jgi:hypothetical protein
VVILVTLIDFLEDGAESLEILGDGVEEFEDDVFGFLYIVIQYL